MFLLLERKGRTFFSLSFSFYSRQRLKFVVNEEEKEEEEVT